MRVIIIEKEKESRDALARLVNREVPSSEILGTYDALPPQKDLRADLKPDLVFIAAESEGFEELATYDHGSFKLVVTTSQRGDAIKAYRLGATDCFLKPYEESHLKRLRQKLGNNEPLNPVSESAAQAESSIQRLALPCTDGVAFVKKANIIYLSAERAYTRVIADEVQSIASKPLKYFEQLLNEPFFFRPHRSYLINLKRVKRLLRKGGGTIEMDNGDLIKLSQTQRESFIKACQHFA